jgi:hypothetical protein
MIVCWSWNLKLTYLFSEVLCLCVLLSWLPYQWNCDPLNTKHALSLQVTQSCWHFWLRSLGSTSCVSTSGGRLGKLLWTSLTGYWVSSSNLSITNFNLEDTWVCSNEFHNSSLVHILGNCKESSNSHSVPMEFPFRRKPCISNSHSKNFAIPATFR